MNRPKLIVDDKIPFLKGVLEKYADVNYISGARTVAADVRDADAIFTRTRTVCNQELLKNSSVKLIATATIGFDHIDTSYCEANGIRWVNAPGCNSGSVQQYVVAALTTLAVSRGLKFNGLSIGIIGVGNVGSKVMRAAEALGMNVLINDPPKEKLRNDGFIETPFGLRSASALDVLLAESDIITCHVPLASDTYHLANARFFNKMKQDAVFINTSRGTVTDSEALHNAAQYRLSAFILDVWENEPLPDAVLLAEAFLATPHIAGYSADGKANGTAACVNEFADFFGIKELKDWYPQTVPLPLTSLSFALDGNNKTPEQVIYEAVVHTYPIIEDSLALKKSPDTFEKQRGNYWIRREFKNYTIIPSNMDASIVQALESLGFLIGQ
jgi:erythronate-4-phosphate dehydrogenase